MQTSIVLMTLGIIAVVLIASRLAARAFGSSVASKGAPATATLLSMGQTGTRVNHEPLIELELRVELDGETFEHTTKQVVPVILLSQLRPGMTVPVGVLTKGNGKRKVAIDYKRLAGGSDPRANDSTNVIKAGHVAGARVEATMGNAAELLARAQSATAQIDIMSETDHMAHDPFTGRSFQPYAFTLTVTRAGQASHQVTMLQRLPQDMIGKVGPGATVPVGVDPDDPNQVVIDWDTYRGAPEPT